MRTFLFGNAKSKAQIIARIAVMLALTLLVQYLTGLAKIQLLTGSFVNMFLLVTAMLCGMIGGITVGLITPFLGYWLQIAVLPDFRIVPFIGIANALLVAAFALITLLFKVAERKGILYIVFTVLAVVIAAAIKFLFMYFVCAKWLFLAFLPAQLAAALAGAAFGVLQLFTALIGGGVATALSIPLRKLSIFSAAE